MKDYEGALSDLDNQKKKYDNFAEIYYYRGLIYNALHRESEALTELEKAKSMVTAGHHLSDIYCEMPDEVFITDIEKAINLITKP